MSGSGPASQRVVAVIPHWNRADLLPGLLQNLVRQTRPFDRIVVVDNGSTDGSAEVAERGGATVLRLLRNQGFASAVNEGIKAEGIDAGWIAILNNDVTLDPAWLERLLLVATKQNVSFATGKILSAASPNVMDGAWDAISRGACALRCGAGMPASGIWNLARPIRMAPMTAALFRRELFREVGLLDERFVSYLEDVDFGLRCAKARRTGVYEPSAIAYHQGSATWGRWRAATVRQIARNQVLLTLKHFKGQPKWPVLAGQLLWGFVAARHGCGWAWLQGKLAGWRLRSEVPSDTHSAGAMRAILQASEDEIYEAQGPHPELYWRLYAWLARPR